MNNREKIIGGDSLWRPTEAAKPRFLNVLLSRLRESMVISSRKFENFEMFCPLGAMKLGVQQKK